MLKTNYKRYYFYELLSSFFAFDTIYYFTARFFTNDNTFIYLGIISFLLCTIFSIYSGKYFNKTYQLKKNAKKEIIKENNNK